jgi:multisubunit Na+/H+ antiporter MnhG subunit
MKHKIISAVILLALEAIIISLALWAGEHFDIPTNILVLDIVVLTIMLVLGGYESFQPLFAMVFKKLDEVASLGLRWMSLAFYMICALVLIVLGVIIPISFFFQLIGQVFLLVILLAAYLTSSTTATLIGKVAAKEEKVLAGRQSMRTAVRQMKDEVAITSGVPEYINEAISEMEEKLRYISPCENPEAIAYEKQFADIAERVVIAMSNLEMNEEAIKKDLLRLHRLIENRKNTYN